MSSDARPVYRVRPATPADAASAVSALQSSITELCVLDHQNDAATLDAWLRNKTVEAFLRWLGDADRSLLVAEVDGEPAVCAVGAVHVRGEIRLCYVRPGHERRGIGSALLRALEQRATDWGHDSVRLMSSLTARRFYERHGFRLLGDAQPGFGVTCCHPYRKAFHVGALGIERRQATDDDLPLMFSINEAALRPYVEATFGPWDEAFQRKLFAKTDSSTHEIFTRDGAPIGFWSVVRTDDEISLNRVSLLPEVQRQGIGTALINELTYEAATRGVPLLLQVFPVNPAQNLYRRLGFCVVGSTPTHVQMEWRA